MSGLSFFLVRRAKRARHENDHARELPLQERLLAVYEQIVEGLNGANCQLSNDLKFNRQPSKRVIFSVNRQICRLILTIKNISRYSRTSLIRRPNGQSSQSVRIKEVTTMTSLL